MENRKFGVVSNERCPLDDLLEVAEDLLNEVGGQLFTPGQVDFDHIGGDLDLSKKYLDATIAALSILDVRDWDDTLKQARSGLILHRRLLRYFNSLDFEYPNVEQPEEDPFVCAVKGTP